ncbi:MAG TPA: hypothetical protein VLH16_05230 [Bacteroidales bacterium]|nr:hypothetical protein [Bacteroidales bacterium]
MSKEIFLTEIDDLIVTLAEQWKTIRSYPGKVPYIELDIFADNIRKLYEYVYLIDKLNKTKEFDIGKVRSEIITDQPVRLQTKFKSAAVELEDTATERQQSYSAAANEPVPPTTVIADHAFDNETAKGKSAFSTVDESAPVSIKEPQSPPLSEPATGGTDLFGVATTAYIGEKHKSGSKTIGEKLKQPGDDNLIGSKMQQSPVSDLKSIIGINDKFLFINELFKGDMTAYNTAINRLNTCNKTEEALSIVLELINIHQMNEQSVSFKRLNDILSRRFPELLS